MNQARPWSHPWWDRPIPEGTQPPSRCGSPYIGSPPDPEGSPGSCSERRFSSCSWRLALLGRRAGERRGRQRREATSPKKVDLDRDRRSFLHDDVERPGELFLRELLSPYPQEVFPARDAGNLEVPLFVRQAKVRCLEDHDVGEHLEMDVAELPLDPRPF